MKNQLPEVSQPEKDTIGMPPCYPFGLDGHLCPRISQCMRDSVACKAFRMYENTGDGSSPKVMTARARLIRPFR